MRATTLDVLAGRATWCVVESDNIAALRAMPPCSVDSIVTDPQYGLGDPPDLFEVLRSWLTTGAHIVEGKGFMGQEWDAFVPQPLLWRECLRVLKPGGHLLASAATRTDHLMKLGIQLAGFEIRDTLAWVFGSGFPKSHNVANDIDKKNGHGPRGRAIPTASTHLPSGKYAEEKLTSNEVERYKARSPEGEPWEGWGTGLKPAFEPITLARKPFRGTVATNVLTHGTGALNIDATRVATDWSERPESWKRSGHSAKPEAEKIAAPPGNGIECHELGRWPANLLHDGSDEVMDAFPDSRGQQGGAVRNDSGGKAHQVMGMFRGQENVSRESRFDSGSAARFFYCAKASRREREMGLESFEHGVTTDGRQTPNDTPYQRGKAPRKNTHPTVKPIALMRWLCRLITPPGGIVLDPFSGSGSTGVAAEIEGFRFIGIDLSDEWCAVARARIAIAKSFVDHEAKKTEAVSA